MKPWVIHERKVKRAPLGAALTARVLGELTWGSAAPLGLKKCVSMPNPGLAPWAMQECRPFRAPIRLPYHFTYFDALALQKFCFG